MKVLLLGNGFDLYHKLPTTYLAFLKTTEYLTKSFLAFPLKIGEVFAQAGKDCRTIKDSYEKYSAIYDNFELDIKKVVSLVELCESNYWWSYFCSCYNKDVGWIDFEQEVSMVLQEFKRFFDNNKNSTIKRDFSAKELGKLACFGFLFSSRPVGHRAGVAENYIIKEIKEEFFKNRQGIYTVEPLDEKKIVARLFNELKEFTKALDLYFQAFVNDPFQEILNKNAIDTKEEIFNGFDEVIDFNYTFTYESLYQTTAKTPPFHIHGALDETMVLGIEPDENDCANGNQLFIDFKKYYQREYMSKNDVVPSIIHRMKRIRKASNGQELNTTYVFGHSLDITDVDIIKPILENTDDIVIFYHNIEAKKGQLRNLYKIFGKEGYEQLKGHSILRFVLIV